MSYRHILTQYQPANSSRRRGRTLSLLLAGGLLVFRLQRAHAEDHVDYRYESYLEDNDRITVETHSTLFEVTLKPRLLDVKGEFVYDAISGATPYGWSPRPTENNGHVRTTQLVEERYAGNVELICQLGPLTLTPQFAISQESDYDSIGLSLNAALALNEKNTTLRAGIAHSGDRVLDAQSTRVWQDKESWDVLVGVSQLLSPKTILALDFTYGTTDGYLNDPYKYIRFEGYFFPTFQHETRPDFRDNEIAMVTLTQFFDPLNASAELSYRFYHDSFDVNAHTATVAWYQKIGHHVILAPVFRYYRQTAANFYYASLPGYEDDPGVPRYYSADYRLSELESFTYGIQVTVLLGEHLLLDAGYKRYEMTGLDGVTSQEMYPNANIFTIGARLTF